MVNSDSQPNPTDAPMTNEATTDTDPSGTLPENRKLDHTLLLSFVDGDEDLLRNLCALFLSMYPPVMSAMRDAILRNDGEALARAAHTLKGSAGYFLTDSARLLLNELERSGRGGEMISAPARLVDLEAELERVKPELSRLAGSVLI